MIETTLSLNASQVERLIQIGRESDAIGDALGSEMKRVRNVLLAEALPHTPVGKYWKAPGNQHIGGTLRRSLQEGGLSLTGKAGPAAARAVLGSNVFYAPFVEFGTKPHVIRPKAPGYPLRFVAGDGSAWIAAWGVNHPGTAPRKMLSNAVAAKQDVIQTLIVRRLMAVLKKSEASGA